MSTGSRTPDQFIADILSPDFVETYYGHLAPEDAAAYPPEELPARVEAHLRVGLTRGPGEAVVRVEPSGANAVVYVVTDDMPFLVDSVTAEIVRQKHGINLVVHPILVATRNRETHELTALRAVPTHAPVASGDTAALADISQFFDGGSHSRLESWIAIEIGGYPDEEQTALLVSGIERILADVKVCVEDWQAMRNKAHEIADNLGWIHGADSVPDLHTASDLLRWLDDGNFTFLGYREYDLATEEGQDVLRARQESSLGLMRRSVGGGVQHLTESGRAKARERRALIITKANSRSTVHRPVYLDYVGIKSFDSQGNVNGERRFIGLFASGAYTRSVRSVPVVRDKVDAVLKASGFASDSHSGKDLLTILETYPRDELFQTEVEDLHEIVTGMLALQERRRTSLFVRPDVYGRFMSAFVFLPRDRYTTSVRLRVEEELRKAFDAESMDFEVRMSESALVRLFYRIRLRRRGDFPVVDRAELEHRLERAVRSWAEGIDEVVRGRYPADQAPLVSRRWAEAFPAAYRVHFEVEDALEDIARFGAYDDPAHRGPVLRVYLPNDADAEEDARLKLYLTEPVSLSQILPVLHNLGLRVLDEKPFEVSRGDGRSLFLYDLGLFYPEGVDPLRTEALLSEAWSAVALDRAESDPFDRLVLKEGMHWRQVAVLRAYTKYLRQLGVPNSYGFVADTVLANPAAARALVTLFESLFDPALDETTRPEAVEAARAALAAGLELVPTLDADRLLRRLAEVIEATLRTNHYQGTDHLAFKLDPSRIDGAPFPRPKYEIWVYSPRVEGVHLRFGDVARGGLRWSDRREDFRTEILGLVKAQVVKNAVIVPTGAKGGFFAKRLPDPAVDRAAWMAEGQAAYRIFIRALLDLTDNLVTGPDGETVVPPRDVVRRDGDDTYLVVAADKGTASFSDIANSISLETGHWLGDAFASGGSVGYDHKAMGITARGAWESVRRHFFELDLDTQAQDFTAVGIGDMSGDVFGNGMLLSRHVRLVAAFDHRHIFLDPDPDPDPETSFAERERLFALPRSSWEDYDASLISEGGGVYPRSAKSVPVSEAVRQVLGLPEGTVRLSPPDLLRAILTAPVDLLYNGGIGTYVKASTETNIQVGDRANDAIRVDGRDLRARVVGEGGNLGMTQLGRVEAALSGVLLNTDAIDNSAGVDCSDHEVNIKILVDRMVEAGKFEATERADFLHAMTDDVARLVLRTNIDQNVLLLNEKQRLAEWSPSFERFMDWLEVAADLDREIEFLPDNAALEARLARGQELTAPELSVLVAYAKIQLSRALAASDLHEDPYFEDTLVRYFPEQIAERFGADVQSHPLRREIIATVVANDMVNLGGITYAFRVMEETGAAEAAVARAFVALREIYELDGFVADVRALPAGFPTDKWCRMQLDQRRLLDRATRWLINHSEGGRTVGEDIAAYRDTVAGLRAELGDLLRGRDAARTVAWRAEALGWGAPEDVADRWALGFESFSLLDVARLAAETGQPARDVAAVYYAVFDRFGVDSLLERITNLPRQDRWQALARAALRDDLYSTVADIARAAMEVAPDTTDPVVRLDAWGERNAEGLGRAMNMFEEVSRLERDDMASLSVALRLLRSIVRR